MNCWSPRSKEDYSLFTPILLLACHERRCQTSGNKLHFFCSQGYQASKIHRGSQVIPDHRSILCQHRNSPTSSRVERRYHPVIGNCGWIFKVNQIVPLRTTIAHDVSETFTKHWVFLYGPPSKLLSDNRKQFIARNFTDVCRVLGISNLYSILTIRRRMAEPNDSTICFSPPSVTRHCANNSAASLLLLLLCSAIRCGPMIPAALTVLHPFIQFSSPRP